MIGIFTACVLGVVAGVVLKMNAIPSWVAYATEGARVTPPK